MVNLDLLEVEIDKAITNILINDHVLINKGQELALLNKIGMYLFSLFQGWDGMGWDGMGC